MLQRRGYTMIPVNPLATEILGERCYPTLGAIPADAASRWSTCSAARTTAGRHVDEAVEIGARAVWMQLGVVDEAAAGARPRGRPAGRDGPVPGDRAAAPGVVENRGGERCRD